MELCPVLCLRWFAVGALVLFLPSSVLAEKQVLYGHVPSAAAQLQPTGTLDESQPLEVLIGLPLRNRGTLTNLLTDLYNPASPSFHQYLTSSQFTEQFGPTPEDYQSVIAFANSNGLTVLHAHANRTILDVSGSVANIEKVFHVHLRVYQHPTQARTFYAPDNEPSVDLATPLLGITGLDNFVIPHPLFLRSPVHKSAQTTSGSGPNGLYSGNDFRAAYVPGTTLTGAGQKVGLFELDSYYPTDITTYESDASVPNITLSNFLVAGATGNPGADNVEVALDIEMAMAMAPGLAGVNVYVGPQTSTGPNAVLNCMATNNAARQLSCSWGYSINSTTVQIFQQFAAQGQSFFLSSGDSDAFTGAAQPPADDPYVTVVGGTTLSTSGPGGSWVSEKVWNWYNDGSGTNGSTGGISTTYAIPSWQAPVSMALNQGSTTMRNLPDVAMTADDIFVVADDGQTYSVGGTSCAAPLWAAFTALVNQQGAINQRASVGFLNPALYALGQGSSYAATFHDITDGNNTNKIVTTKYFAQPGYDLCTGWGTPNGTNMINALAPSATTPVLTAMVALVSESCLPTNGVIDPGETVTVNLTVTNLSPVGTASLVAALQGSSAVLAPSGPQTYGPLKQGEPAVTQPFTFTADGVCGQTISVVWQLQDGPASVGSVSFNFTLGTPVSGTTLSQNFDSVAATNLPTGWTTAISGEQIDWVTTTAAADTAPNAAFADDATNAGVAYLYSPVIPVVSTNAQLTFRQNYNLESETVTGRHSTTTYYFDGGVLDVAIGSGIFTDIISAGGSFVTGGYNGTLYTGSGNPRAGSSAWGGNSGGWITSIINLPAAAAGQNVQLRWGCATDSGNDSPVVGWYVDTIALTDAYYSCCTPVNNSAPLTIVPSSVILNGSGGLSLSVNSSPGVNYSLEYKNSLTDIFWVLLPSSTVVGTGGIITLQDTSPRQAQRYYQVVAN